MAHRKRQSTQRSADQDDDDYIDSGSVASPLNPRRRNAPNTRGSGPAVRKRAKLNNTATMEDEEEKNPTSSPKAKEQHPLNDPSATDSQHGNAGGLELGEEEQFAEDFPIAPTTTDVVPTSPESVDRGTEVESTPPPQQKKATQRKRKQKAEVEPVDPFAPREKYLLYEVLQLEMLRHPEKHRWSYRDLYAVTQKPEFAGKIYRHNGYPYDETLNASTIRQSLIAKKHLIFESDSGGWYLKAYENNPPPPAEASTSQQQRYSPVQQSPTSDATMADAVESPASSGIKTRAQRQQLKQQQQQQQLANDEEPAKTTASSESTHSLLTIQMPSTPTPTATPATNRIKTPTTTTSPFLLSTIVADPSPFQQPAKSNATVAKANTNSDNQWQTLLAAANAEAVSVSATEPSVTNIKLENAVRPKVTTLSTSDVPSPSSSQSKVLKVFVEGVSIGRKVVIHRSMNDISAFKQMLADRLSDALIGAVTAANRSPNGTSTVTNNARTTKGSQVDFDVLYLENNDPRWLLLDTDDRSYRESSAYWQDFFQSVTEVKLRPKAD